jgi:myo-inositol-1-phosphate synthase
MKRIGICIAGLNGAVATTFVAGVALMRRGLAAPVAMLSEDYVASHDLAPLDAFVFGGWDVRGENCFDAALRNRVIEPLRMQPIAKELASLKPWRPSEKNLARDIERFRRKHKLARVIVLNLLPTGLHAASKQYALAALQTDSPFINFTPNDCGEGKLAAIPFCGRDGKTGQTWLKSVLAPAFRARGLRVTGWYSTNLLGNEDGRVVGDPEQGKAKIDSKSKLLADMLGYAPHHQVQINFYPPRGDNKESWDNIDFEGFLGMPMQLKVNGLWRDSILAAPMCVDLARFMEWAQRRGERGAQEWLSFYFKSPAARRAKNPPPHDAPAQELLLRQFLASRVNP